MNSTYYQNKANDANREISNAQSSMKESISFVNNLISRIPSDNGYDALGSNSYNSLDAVKSEITQVSEFGSIRDSITNKAIMLDQELDRKSEEDNGDTNEE